MLSKKEKEKRKKEAQRRWREKNKEKVASYQKDYAAKNKEELAAKKKTYQAANKDKQAARDKRYRERNKEKVRERKRLYRARKKIKEQATLIIYYMNKQKPIHDVWGFIEKFYPNYSSSDEIARNEDLFKIIAGDYEPDSDAAKLLQEYDGDMKRIKSDYEASNAEIMRKAIHGWLNVAKEYTKDVYFICGDTCTSAYHEVTELSELSDDQIILMANQTNSIVGSIDSSPADIAGEALNIADGWFSMEIITEEEYNYINKRAEDIKTAKINPKKDKDEPKRAKKENSHGPQQ